jgi:hypothetical protein
LTELDRRVYNGNATAALVLPFKTPILPKQWTLGSTTSSALLQRAKRVNMKIHAIVVPVLAVGVLAGVPLAASQSRADPSQGLCNAVIAQALGTAVQVATRGPTEAQCTEIGAALAASLEAPCLDLILDTELGIIKASNAPTGELSNLGTLICTSLDACGFTPLPFGLCPGF